MTVRSYWVQDWKATSVGIWARAVTDSPCGLPLTVLWSPREPAVLQEENVDLSGGFLQKVDLGPFHIETSLGSSTIPDPFASLLEGIWNLKDEQALIWVRKYLFGGESEPGGGPGKKIFCMVKMFFPLFRKPRAFGFWWALVQAAYARVAFAVLGKLTHILKSVYTFKNVFQSVQQSGL